MAALFFVFRKSVWCFYSSHYLRLLLIATILHAVRRLRFLNVTLNFL